MQATRHVRKILTLVCLGGCLAAQAGAGPAEGAAVLARRSGPSLALSEAAPGGARAAHLAPPAPLLAQRAILPPKGDNPVPFGKPDARLPGAPRRKSPAVAGLLSAIVPGAGQAYLGSQSAYLFAGVEAAAWAAKLSTKATGNQKEREFKRFADSHWSFDRYRDQNSGPCPVNGHSDGGVQDSTLVMLYETRRDDWYEDIGKLQIYACGWDDQVNRTAYRDMRQDSNSFLSKSRTATSVILLNHLVSALLAARGATKHNLRLTGGLELDWKLTPSLTQTSGRVMLRQTF